MEVDASHSTLVIRDITATADIPPRLPSPSPVAGPSTRSPGTEHIEHRPLRHMHIPDDIV